MPENRRKTWKFQKTRDQFGCGLKGSILPPRFFPVKVSTEPKISPLHGRRVGQIGWVWPSWEKVNSANGDFHRNQQVNPSAHQWFEGIPGFESNKPIFWEAIRLDSILTNLKIEASCFRFWPEGKRPVAAVSGITILKNRGKMAFDDGGLDPKSRRGRSIGPPFPGIPAGRSGVYLFRDSNGEVQYVGKAKCLRKRLAQYPLAADSLSGEGFQKHMAEIWAASERVDWLPVPDELGALVLELDLVGRLKPRFNRALNPPPRRLLWLIHQPGRKKALRFVADPNKEGEVLFGPIRGGSWTTKVLEALIPAGEPDNTEQIQTALSFAKGEGTTLIRELESAYSRGAEGMGNSNGEVDSIIRRIAVLKAFDQRRFRQKLALGLCGFYPICSLGPEAWNHPIVPGRKWFYTIWEGRIRGVIEMNSPGKSQDNFEGTNEKMGSASEGYTFPKGPEEPLLLQAWLDRSSGNSQSFVCAQITQSTGSSGSA